MKIESNLSSSAQTAQEIKTHLQQLRKSSRHRKRQLGGSSGNVGGRVNDGRDRDDAQRLDGLRKIFSRLIELGEFDLESGGGDEGGNGVSSQWKAWLTTHHDDCIAASWHRLRLTFLDYQGTRRLMAIVQTKRGGKERSE